MLSSAPNSCHLLLVCNEINSRNTNVKKYKKNQKRDEMKRDEGLANLIVGKQLSIEPERGPESGTRTRYISCVVQPNYTHIHTTHTHEHEHINTTTHDEYTGWPVLLSPLLYVGQDHLPGEVAVIAPVIENCSKKIRLRPTLVVGPQPKNKRDGGRETLTLKYKQNGSNVQR